jgi:hypothetical protein
MAWGFVYINHRSNLEKQNITSTTSAQSTTKTFTVERPTAARDTTSRNLHAFLHLVLWYQHKLSTLSKVKMYFNTVVASAILAFATGALAAPVPQLAGEGAAANSILSGTDNAVGYSIEDALDNTANLITKTKGGVPATPAVPAGSKARRQLAGEGAAADSVLSDTDNGTWPKDAT